MRLRPMFVTALLATTALPLHAAPAPASAPLPAKNTTTAATVTAPAAKAAATVPAPAAATSAPAAEAPIRMPPVSGINNSRTPTEIQISVPGQPSYTTVIPPAPPARKNVIVPTGAAAPACAHMKAPYRSGLWEITSVSNNTLMPQPVTAKIKRCVTERDAQNACGLNQLSGGRNRDCQIADMQVSGNTATWSMTCEGTHFSGQGSGKSTFTADAYHGSFDMTASMQGNTMQMNTTFTGKRLGNCK